MTADNQALKRVPKNPAQHFIRDFWERGATAEAVSFFAQRQKTNSRSKLRRRAVNYMKALHMVAWILVIVGGLNWLVFGLFGWDVGHLFGGMDMMISKVIYVLVGLGALYELFTHKNNCKFCGNSMNKPAM